MRLNKQANYESALKSVEKRRKLMEKSTFLYEKACKRLNRAINALPDEDKAKIPAKIEVNFGGVNIPVEEYDTV